mmetsp:Transcript_35822/g.41798  ORF Transcript_35822/g.41798 Transcript_35822/m.41798 type:complete len:97 (+) Transcript_35822:3-293(+)
MRKIEVYLEDLVEMRDWNCKEAFKTIDHKAQGSLTPFNILEFLRTRDVIASYDDVLSFLRKADKDEDGRVSYREFMDLFKATNARPGVKKSPPKKI